METINIKNRITAFGKEVKTFPDGIGEAFDELVNVIDGGFTRPLYGICFELEGKLCYIAAAEEKFPGEGKRHGCKDYQIEPGLYGAVQVHDWLNRIPVIKETFCTMFENELIDKTAPAVEVYENDDVMTCMVRLKEQPK
jgi:hypothetical protein